MENYSDLHGICIKIFEAVAKTTSVFVLPLFLGRIVFSNVLGEGSKALSALKGAVIYFCLIIGFPLIIEILFSIPDSYLPKFNSLSSLAEGSPAGVSFGIIPFALDRIIEVILAALYWIVYYLHVFFMLVMCSMAPIVFLTSTLLGFGLGLEVFLGLLIVGSSWPIIWYGFDQVHASLVSAQTDAFGAKCLELLITILKGLSPVAFASLAVKSPAGQMVGKAAQSSIAAGKWSVFQAAKIPAMAANTHRETKSQYYSKDRISQLQDLARNKTFSANKDDRLKNAKKQNLEKEPEKGERKNENSRPRDIQA